MEVVEVIEVDQIVVEMVEVVEIVVEVTVVVGEQLEEDLTSRVDVVVEVEDQAWRIISASACLRQTYLPSWQ